MYAAASGAEDTEGGAGAVAGNASDANTLAPDPGPSSTGAGTSISHDGTITETSGMMSKPLSTRLQMPYRIAAEARRSSTVASHAAPSKIVAFSNTSVITSRANGA